MDATAPMHVSLVTETYPPEVNGCAMTVSHFVEGLLARGHLVQLVRPRQKGESGVVRNGNLEIVATPGLPIPMYRFQKFGFPVLGTLHRLWRKVRPDVVYVATEGPLGWAALRVCRDMGLPLVSGFHTNFQQYTGHYGIAPLRRFIVSYLKAFHRRTACTLVPTEDQRDAMGSDYGDVRTVSRGVDTDLYSPARRSDDLRRQWGVGDDGLAVIYVGRIAEEKNLGVTVRAFEAMREVRPDAHLVLVGDGPMRQELEPQYPDYVFCGVQRGEDLAAHYASGDVFPFASWTETFGNVTTEGLASGLAVVAYNYAAAHMHIRHEESGLLAPPGDADAFVAQAVRLAQDPSLVARLRANARRVAEGITWDSICGRFEEILVECAGRQ